ncbi:MAG: rsgA [Burkholderiales bacterium]|jgi:ribosome biogenesis GTPase|nr:rsgA [Burkholderiales bacterium]
MPKGLITKSYGRGYIVEVDGSTYTAVTKAKKVDYVVGDWVVVDIINDEQVQITDLIPRANLVYRMDHNRSKLIASNIDQILIVIAIKPNFNPNFLNSCLLFAESAGINPYIIVNKSDMTESFKFIQQITNLYHTKLGYTVISLSAQANCNSLTPLLKERQSVLIGQSGVGKSTITNQIIPEAFTSVDSITKAETSGRHTTTNATLYHIDKTSGLIDCPGLQEFGLYHLSVEELPELFPELRPHLNKCRFRNCRHLNEPGCMITKAHADGEIDEIRYQLLQTLTEKLSQKTNYRLA